MKRGRFLCKPPVSHFEAVFSEFLVLGSIIYHPANKSAANRVFEKNNVFCEKLRKKLWKLENNA